MNPTTSCLTTKQVTPLDNFRNDGDDDDWNDGDGDVDNDGDDDDDIGLDDIENVENDDDDNMGDDYDDINGRNENNFRVCRFGFAKTIKDFCFFLPQRFRLMSTITTFAFLSSFFSESKRMFKRALNISVFLKITCIP